MKNNNTRSNNNKCMNECVMRRPSSCEGRSFFAGHEIERFTGTIDVPGITRLLVFMLLICYLSTLKHNTYYGGEYQIGPTVHTHKNLYISLFLLTIFGLIYYGPP